MKCGTRSLAVLGALALSAMGLVPAAWAADVGQADSGQSAQVDVAQVEQSRGSEVSQSGDALAKSGAVQAGPTQPAEPSTPENSAQSGEASPGLVDTPIPDIQAVGEGDDSAMVGATVTTFGVVTAAYPAAESGLGAPAGNVDSGDGQGNANAIRVAQAGALASFAARFSDKPTLLVGDFNSYSQEDPIKALEAAGWERVSGAGEASYVYADAPVPSTTSLPTRPRSRSWRASPAGLSTLRSPSPSNTRGPE